MNKPVPADPGLAAFRSIGRQLAVMHEAMLEAGMSPDAALKVTCEYVRTLFGRAAPQPMAGLFAVRGGHDT